MSTRTNIYPTWNTLDGKVVTFLMIVNGLILQIPVLLYIKNILKIATEDNLFFVWAFPLLAVIVLALIQILFLEYYWRRTKIRKNRKMILLGLKAMITVTITYFLLLIGFFFYLVEEADWLGNLFVDDPVFQLTVKLAFALGIMLFIANMMAKPPERVLRRMRRGKK
ncbi:MAG: hypothetical protein ACTSYA_11895 [Candidatus Kariarchaeaceae archaeon]